MSCFIAAGEPPSCKLITEYQPPLVEANEVLYEGATSMRFSSSTLAPARSTSASVATVAGSWSSAITAQAHKMSSADG